MLFDLARYNLAMQIGLFRYVRRTKSAFVVGGSTIRYRHRLRPWRRTEIRTRLVGMDERFFYSNNGRCSMAGRARWPSFERVCARRAWSPAVMTGIGLRIEPFTEPWVDEWNAWDDARSCPRTDQTLGNTPTRAKAPQTDQGSGQEAVAEVHSCREADFLCFVQADALREHVT